MTEHRAHLMGSSSSPRGVTQSKWTIQHWLQLTCSLCVQQYVGLVRTPTRGLSSANHFSGHESSHEHLWRAAPQLPPATWELSGQCWPASNS